MQGIVIAIVPLLFRLVTKGPKSFRKYADLFGFFQSLPFGRALFSSLVGVTAPYSASIGATILSFDAKSVTCSIEDRPWLRNPFSSIHAIALANLGELASGLGVMSTLQNIKTVRGIPVSVNTKYMKKSRGTITATCSLANLGQQLKGITTKSTIVVETIMRDASGDQVAVCQVVWQFSVKKGKARESKKED
jgi:acyl-coenzyme A thioesterase PaaI-like protein